MLFVRGTKSITPLRGLVDPIVEPTKQLKPGLLKINCANCSWDSEVAEGEQDRFVPCPKCRVNMLILGTGSMIFPVAKSTAAEIENQLEAFLQDETSSKSKRITEFNPQVEAWTESQPDSTLMHLLSDPFCDVTKLLESEPQFDPEVVKQVDLETESMPVESSTQCPESSTTTIPPASEPQFDSKIVKQEDLALEAMSEEVSAQSSATTAILQASKAQFNLETVKQEELELKLLSSETIKPPPIVSITEERERSGFGTRLHATKSCDETKSKLAAMFANIEPIGELNFRSKPGQHRRITGSLQKAPPQLKTSDLGETTAKLDFVANEDNDDANEGSSNREMMLDEVSKIGDVGDPGKFDSNSTGNKRFRPFACTCGFNFENNSCVFGAIICCLNCRGEFTFQHPPEDFWVVLPDRSLDEYQQHAIEVWRYAEALHNTPELFLGTLRQILRTLGDIRLFASNSTQVDTIHGTSGVEVALRRLSKGPTFGGYTSPHIMQADWKSSEQSQIAMPSVVTFVMDTMTALRELKRILTDNTC